MATKTLQPDPDEMLKQLAAEAATQGENLRVAVRELTLNALRSRELSLAQTAGSNLRRLGHSSAR